MNIKATSLYNIPSVSLQTMPAILAIVAAILVAIYLVLQCILHVTQSTREPRLTESNVPFIGPVIGMARHQARYLASLGYVHTSWFEGSPC